MATTQVDLLAATERSFRNAMPCTFSVLVHICITCVQWLLHSTDRLALAALPAHAVLLQRASQCTYARSFHDPQTSILQSSDAVRVLQLQQMYCWSRDHHNMLDQVHNPCHTETTLLHMQAPPGAFAAASCSVCATMCAALRRKCTNIAPPALASCL